MRIARIALIAVMVAGCSGCALQPRPAKTEVKPGESSIAIEREERRPSETTLRIRATMPAPIPQEGPGKPGVRIRVFLPPEGKEPGK